MLSDRTGSGSNPGGSTMRTAWMRRTIAGALVVGAACVPASPAAGAEVRKGDGYEVAFPTRLQDGPVRYTQGRHSVTFRLLGARGRPSLTQKTALVEGAMRDVSVGFIAGHSALKEGLVLKSRGAPDTFRYRVRTSPG